MKRLLAIAIAESDKLVTAALLASMPHLVLWITSFAGADPLGRHLIMGMVATTFAFLLWPIIVLVVAYLWIRETRRLRA